MESNNNNISENTLFSNNSTSSSTSTDNGFFDSLKNINTTTWILIVFILAFLGFNIFAFLAQGTQEITNFFAPILKLIFGSAAKVTGEVVDVSAEGAKKVVTGTADVLESGLTAIQNVTPNINPQGAKSSVKGEPVNQQNQQQQQQNPENTSLNNALNDSSQDYQANEASSSVHSSSGKAGWCFVGVDRGIRTCAQVGVNDTCMSGDIFPSQEICMNPNLRS
jgi:hypothetical protein